MSYDIKTESKRREIAIASTYYIPVTAENIV